MKLLFPLFLFSCLHVFSQDIVIGSSLDHVLRLLPSRDSASSGLIRPSTFSKAYTSNSQQLFSAYLGSKNSKKNLFRIMPVDVQTNFVQHHPSQLNDGNMIPSKGFQSLTSTGFYAKLGFLELQYIPEWVVAQNKSYDGFPEDHDQGQWRDYYRWYNNIELPERLSYKKYDKIKPGQSFFRTRIGKIGMGISTQNIWWGPGYRNALLMSNVAPGFPHISIKTLLPINTKLGSFEFEILGGRLANANMPPPDTLHRAMGILLYLPKQNISRVISGAIMTYSPKWIKGLALGIEQTSVRYEYQMKLLNDYIPFQRPFKKVKTDDEEKQLLQTGIFIRYNIPKANLEFYTELATNRSDRTFRELMLEPQSGAASIYGIRKIIPKATNQYYEMIAEFTTLQQQLTGDLLSPRSWYVNPFIRQGHTNEGQLLGAGVGPGGKSQLIELNWRSNLNRIGISFDRIQHNNDYMIFTYKSTADFRRFWTDFIFSMKADWKFKHLLAGVNLNFIKTNNYQWWLFQPMPGEYFIQGRDVYQLNASASLRYYIK